MPWRSPQSLSFSRSLFNRSSQLARHAHGLRTQLHLCCNLAPGWHPAREQQLPHCHMITLRPVAPPHCPAWPVQCAPRMGCRLKKVNFGHFDFKTSKSTARKRQRLALYPCILSSPYYITVKELSHLNQFCASYRSRSAKSKIQKCSRQ